MSGQRARSAVAVDHRSAHPNIAGIPWWGAVLTAVFAVAIGFAFDAGSGGGQLTAVFASLYVLGCLTAVLAVRQSGLFTAVIQPPLVLFVTVPGAYFLMHSSDIQGLKDVLINCGYPLIERFPLMFFTSAAVLLIGLARWYFGKAGRADATKQPERATRDAGPSLATKLSALAGLFGGRSDESDDDVPQQRRAAERRRPRQQKPTPGRTRGERPARRTPPRSRHSRAPETEIIEPVIDERPRRRRERLSEPPPSEPRRRPRPSSSREPRERDSREPLPPRERRARYERDDRYERPQRERPARRSRYDDYDARDSQDLYGSPSSHHPVSRVRYRGEDSEDRAEYRARRRAPREADADRWEYDI